MTAQAPSCETCGGEGFWDQPCGDCGKQLPRDDCQPKPSEGTQFVVSPMMRIAELEATIERQAGEIAAFEQRLADERQVFWDKDRDQRNAIENRDARLEAMRKERDAFIEKAATNMRLYMDLLMQVVHVVPGETRHESAKRIINQHENQSHGPACAAIAAGDGK